MAKTSRPLIITTGGGAPAAKTDWGPMALVGVAAVGLFYFFKGKVTPPYSTWIKIQTITSVGVITPSTSAAFWIKFAPITSIGVITPSVTAAYWIKFVPITNIGMITPAGILTSLEITNLDDWLYQGKSLYFNFSGG